MIMPYIKKIELKGFKSFGPQTIKITLDKGFTVITGPNGSGKTNIVDAILFALGELSVKRLRAETAAGLIFQGSDKAGLEKAKMARVVIQFDNSDGRIPVNTANVTISREVYRNGQSVYRLNGRRISRSHLMEILSVAGISFTGQNIILQGTITRLADISPLERRKMIEDLVGIAQYDAEKAEAEEKLREADLSIRTAMGRIDEVQRRIEDLERERNELLRYNLLKNEIRRFEAIKLSYDIAQIQEKIERDSIQAERIRDKLEKIKAIRDQYRLKRKEIEDGWRKLSSEIVEGEGSQVLKVQMKIGELKSKIIELTTKINSGKTTLESLRRIRENIFQQYQSIRNELRENRLKIRRLKSEYEQLLNQVDAKQAEYNTLSQEIAQLWENIDENSKKMREMEIQLDKDLKRIAFLKSEQVKSRTAIKIREKRLRDLKERRERFVLTLNELEKSKAELEMVQREQRNQLKNLERMLERRTAQKEVMEKEISEAGKIANSAREAIVEFNTQRKLAETFATEEKALKSIEELGELGVIPGVYGRLRNLVKVDREYEQVIEVAAGGWLDAIVVKNLNAAFMCAETLRRMKLGRIKIIPIEGVSVKPIKTPNIEGVIGAAFSFVKCAREFEPAVHFVLGDTLIVQEDKIALELFNKGYRVITINGNLYEPGGALEGGCYRAPIDFSAIIPSDAAIKSLDNAVKALQQHLMKKGDDIASLKEEIDRIRVEIARLSEAITMLDGEIARVRRSIKRTKVNIKRMEFNIRKVEGEIEAEKVKIWKYQAEKSDLQREIHVLQRELAILRQKTDPVNIQEMEIRRGKITEEINVLRQKLGALQAEISTLQSQYDNVLRTGYKNAKIQLLKVEQQLKNVKSEVEEALKEREQLKQELAELEKNRDKLSKTFMSAKEEAQKFAVQIDKIDQVLRKLDAEYEEADRLWNQYQLNIQKSLIQLEQWQSQLKQFGYEKPLNVTLKEVEEAEAILKMLKLEFERIEGVNQLALSHYAEQIARYKELSLRLNELEMEKQAIIKFMEDVESKKRKAFLEAFERINQNFQRYFSKLSGGGFATLKLESPEDPFIGGVEMIVQFPNKPPIVVSGASGGERSVAAVAFLFAIKDFTPAAFYIIDEADAYLDAFHVSRLADLLLEESERAQFIVITLKPEIVSKAQKVYGVYELNGVSHVVSAKFLEVPS
jgi:chromosome segregation protein